MKNKISFFAMVKNFNTGEVEKYDVMPLLYNSIYDNEGNASLTFYVFDEKFNKLPVNNKKRLRKFVIDTFRYYYWARCEYEFIAIDWPYRTELKEGEDIININRPVKIDVYQQIEPNIDIIVDLLWEEVKNIKFKE